MFDELLFENLDPVDARLRELCRDVTHLTVHEVIDRNRYDQLARICFSGVDLAPFVEPRTTEDGFSDDQAPETLDGEAEESDLAMAVDGITFAELCAAGSRWIRHIAAVNMTGLGEAKFKVNFWRGKGDKVVFSSRFRCINPDYEPPPPLTPDPTPLPTTLSDTAPEARTWRALGEGYTHCIALLQNGYAHLSGLQNATIATQNHQLVRLQKSLEGVLGELTKLKVGVYEVEYAQRADGGESKVREELGKQFISELGGLGRVFASAKFGMAPELVELAEIVNASPELLGAMKNPEVRKILRDEKTRKELAELLLMAAKAGAPNTPPPDQSAAA